ncbi:hypothetical protein [Octadecabacter antarcticus]|uniref:hypothetical protein n=1 Tax=Octadecabacter antarcticus TaxID=1217908 RepID=UPI001181A63B|nr:hypothetical protein [Octadecabacter antarcticus]
MKKMTAKNALEISVQLSISRYESRLESARVALGLLNPDDTVAQKKIQLVAERQRCKELEDLKRDKSTFSKTFSKSNQRMIVQGGAPGLKR